MTEIILYNSIGVYSGKWVSKYDNQGNLIESFLHGADGSLKATWYFKHDKQGNVIEAFVHDVGGNLIEKWSLNYEFDNRGNWVKKFVSINEKPTYNKYSEIEYF